MMTSRIIDAPLVESLIKPNWQPMPAVNAFTTTRQGGISLPPYDSLNLAYHVQDNAQTVNHNRTRLAHALKQSAIVWLDQQHTTDCIYVDKVPDEVPIADAVWTDQPGLVLAVMTADCLPILLTNGERICAIHAGWRGLVDGIVENSLAQCVTRLGGADNKNWQAWIGPAILAAHFEVGDDVRQLFIAKHPSFSRYFVAQNNQKWLADLAGIAEAILCGCGIQKVSQSGLCSYANSAQFYSYRRDGQTGRMASVIWLEG